ncbi:MAG: ParB/RepB/Spo0J family partition protein [Geminicoccaceae bacterium]
MSQIGTESRPSPRKRGLGMGLSALLGGAAALAEGARTVPIEFLRPSALQPRRHFGEGELAALADSIRVKGVMQPLLVRRVPNDAEQYEIVAGERRWRAAQLAGCHELPVVVYALSDREALEVALLENVQRQDLTPLEEAEGYRRLIDEFGHTQDELAQSLGKSRSHIANLIRLLGLPGPLRAMLDGGQLSAGHARALLGARDPTPLARQVVARGLNVRQTETLVRNERQAIRSGSQGQRDADTMALEHDLSSRLGLPVRVQPKAKGGTLSIEYRSLEQLDGLVRRLT